MVKIEDGNEPSGSGIVEEAEAIVEEAAAEVAAEQDASGANAAPEAGTDDTTGDADDATNDASGTNDTTDAADATNTDAANTDAAGASDPETAAESEAKELTVEEQLAAAQEEVADWQGKFMRLHAEWDTYRRRTNEQRAEEKTRATEGLVENLLPVIDDFERSIGYAQENGEAGLLEGVKQVHAKLVEVLTKNGVEVIDPAGEAFDALAAQAVAKVEDASVPDETVHEVYQKGYRMGRKVIRPAMVTVTTGGPARELEEAQDEKDVEGAAEGTGSNDEA